MLNGILYVLTTGCRWMDVPKCYGHYSTAWRRLKRWGREGVWPRIVEALASKGYSMGKLRLDGSPSIAPRLRPGKGGARRVRWV